MYDLLKNQITIKYNLEDDTYTLSCSVRRNVVRVATNKQVSDPYILDAIKSELARHTAQIVAEEIDVDLDKYNLVRGIPIENLFDMVGWYRSGRLCDSLGRPLYPSHEILDLR